MTRCKLGQLQLTKYLIKVSHNDARNLNAICMIDEQCHFVKAFCVLLVFDSYNIEFLARIPEINATLKTFVHTLVKEEIRDKFIGREAYKILKVRQ